MSSTNMDPAGRMLAYAADLIEGRGWDATADPYASDASGALSVRGAVELASQTTGAPSDDGLCDLAAYVIDTVLIPAHSIMVSVCPSCTQCRAHTHRPLTLIRDGECPDGCLLCAEHVHLSDPHGYDAPPTDEIVDAWEGYLPHQRDVISGLRAAASRPGL